jgi:hypothetical protein
MAPKQKKSGRERSCPRHLTKYPTRILANRPSRQRSSESRRSCPFSRRESLPRNSTTTQKAKRTIRHRLYYSSIHSPGAQALSPRRRRTGCFRNRKQGRQCSRLLIMVTFGNVTQTKLCYPSSRLTPYNSFCLNNSVELSISCLRVLSTFSNLVRAGWQPAPFLSCFTIVCN